MGYVVLHLKKALGNDAGTSAHIERTIHPKNADESRTHLNRELISFPQNVKNRTEAIQHRIENAGITRKIKNQIISYDINEILNRKYNIFVFIYFLNIIL
ncbi:hypothetical protein EZS27_031156 [termite gut metagenome]|uniref:Plasmid recombination enzyme n=1 Tax=termite gut metagenome TaxID=433724 RepID=A0A5J4QE45_9ZZZZ